MKSARLRAFGLWAVTIGLFLAFVYYLFINADKYVQLLRLSSAALMWILVLSLVVLVLAGAMTTIMFRALGAELSGRDGFLLNAASTLANQLPISGGIVARAFYLKRKHQLPYTKFLSATVALFLLFVCSNGLLGLVILFGSGATNRSPVPLLLGFGGMSACIVAFWLPVHRLPMPGRFRHMFVQALEGWSLLGSDLPLLGKLLGLQGLAVVLLAARYWLAFHMVSQNVTFWQAMLFSAATVLTQLVGIAPGGLGVREAIVAAVASALGFDTAASVLAVGLDRLVTTIPILVAGGVSTVLLGKQISEQGAEVEPHT